MDETISTSMSLPLDEAGFLRRECPTCEREFKWHHTEDGESEPMPEGGYFCPYCAVQAGPNAWFTKPQLELAEQTLAHEVVGPKIDEVLSGFSGGSGAVRFEVSGSSAPDAPRPLGEEPNDMRRVDFECHPKEPVKVLEDWSKPVHCLVCGNSA